MIHLLDPNITRAQAEHWERKTRTNNRISLSAVTIAVTIVGIILAVAL